MLCGNSATMSWMMTPLAHRNLTSSGFVGRSSSSRCSLPLILQLLQFVAAGTVAFFVMSHFDDSPSSISVLDWVGMGFMIIASLVYMFTLPFIIPRYTLVRHVGHLVDEELLTEALKKQRRKEREKSHRKRLLDSIRSQDVHEMRGSLDTPFCMRLFKLLQSMFIGLHDDDGLGDGGKGAHRIHFEDGDEDELSLMSHAGGTRSTLAITPLTQLTDCLLPLYVVFVSWSIYDDNIDREGLHRQLFPAKVAILSALAAEQLAVVLIITASLPSLAYAYTSLAFELEILGVTIAALILSISAYQRIDEPHKFRVAEAETFIVVLRLLHYVTRQRRFLDRVEKYLSNMLGFRAISSKHPQFLRRSLESKSAAPLLEFAANPSESSLLPLWEFLAMEQSGSRMCRGWLPLVGPLNSLVEACSDQEGKKIVVAVHLASDPEETKAAEEGEEETKASGSTHSSPGGVDSDNESGGSEDLDKEGASPEVPLLASTGRALMLAFDFGRRQVLVYSQSRRRLRKLLAFLAAPTDPGHELEDTRGSEDRFELVDEADALAKITPSAVLPLRRVLAPGPGSGLYPAAVTAESDLLQRHDSQVGGIELMTKNPLPAVAGSAGGAAGVSDEPSVDHMRNAFFQHQALRQSGRHDSGAEDWPPAPDMIGIRRNASQESLEHQDKAHGHRTKPRSLKLDRLHKLVHYVWEEVCETHPTVVEAYGKFSVPILRLMLNLPAFEQLSRDKRGVSFSLTTEEDEPRGGGAGVDEPRPDDPATFGGAMAAGATPRSVMRKTSRATEAAMTAIAEERESRELSHPRPPTIVTATGARTEDGSQGAPPSPHSSLMSPDTEDVVTFSLSNEGLGVDSPRRGGGGASAAPAAHQRHLRTHHLSPEPRHSDMSRLFPERPSSPNPGSAFRSRGSSFDYSQRGGMPHGEGVLVSSPHPGSVHMIHPHHGASHQYLHDHDPHEPHEYLIRRAGVTRKKMVGRSLYKTASSWEDGILMVLTSSELIFFSRDHRPHIIEGNILRLSRRYRNRMKLNTITACDLKDDEAPLASLRGGLRRLTLSRTASQPETLGAMSPDHAHLRVLRIRTPHFDVFISPNEAGEAEAWLHDIRATIDDFHRGLDMDGLLDDDELDPDHDHYFHGSSSSAFNAPMSAPARGLEHHHRHFRP